MIKLIRTRATQADIQQMLEALGGYVKVAVDLRLGVLAGGGVMHADCERVLLDSGSRQDDVWGGDWYPAEKRVEYGSLINLRPRLGNRSMELQSPELRARMDKIIRDLLQI